MCVCGRLNIHVFVFAHTCVCTLFGQLSALADCDGCVCVCRGGCHGHS